MTILNQCRFFGFKLILLTIILITGVSEYSYSQTLAFPGAEGFGKFAKGGRGGEIHIVTNLNNAGKGSLREALEANGPRIVLFKVSGIIKLESPIVINNPYLTIAGQSAPAEGIGISGNGINIITHDVIIRFIRIRPGDINYGLENSWAGLDALTIGKDKSIKKVGNIIIDHCSFSWAVDENVDVWYKANNITIQNSIISEALAESKHPKGSHSKGMLIGGEIDSISVLNNIFVSNHARNPRFSNSGLTEFRNNIIYNARNFGLKISNSQVNEIQQLDIVNNYFIKGPSTKFSNPISIWKPEKYNGQIYMQGNSGFNQKEDWQLIENWQSRLIVDNYSEFESDTSFVKRSDSLKTLKQILYETVQYVGSSLPSRDNVDFRIVEELLELKGKIINSQSEVNDWELTFTESEYIDENENGIPDEYENRYDIFSASDLNDDFDNDGYTNVEEYLNGTNPISTESEKKDVFEKFLSIESTSATSNSNYITNEGLVILNNYPNPFVSETIIPVWIYREQFLSIVIVNLLGQIVFKLFEGEISPGVYEFKWNSKLLTSGIYYVYAKNNFGSFMKSVTKIN